MGRGADRRPSADAPKTVRATSLRAVSIPLSVDDYGNGVIGAYNRKGKGRTLKPGP